MKINHKVLSLISIASLSVFASATQSQAAILSVFGEDKNVANGGSAPNALPNSVAAYLTGLNAVLPNVPALEDFEGFNLPDQSDVSLLGPLTFTTSGGTSVNATITGNALFRNQADPLDFYSTTAQRLVGTGEDPTATRADNPNYIQVQVAGTSQFNVKFSEAIGSFGFFGTDVGDFGGTLSVRFKNNGVVIDTIEIPTSPGSNGSTSGYAIFQGFLAETATDVFDEIDFISTQGAVTENFGFDDFAIALFEDTPQPPTSTTPEPGTLISLGLLATVGFVSRRRKDK